jgi:WD40 repeat protein
MDQTLTVRNVDDGTKLRSLASPTNIIPVAALSADGKRAMASSCDGRLKIWDVDTGKELRAFSP